MTHLEVVRVFCSTLWNWLTPLWFAVGLTWQSWIFVGKIDPTYSFFDSPVTLAVNSPQSCLVLLQSSSSIADRERTVSYHIANVHIMLGTVLTEIVKIYGFWCTKICEDAFIQHSDNCGSFSIWYWNRIIPPSEMVSEHKNLSVSILSNKQWFAQVDGDKLPKMAYVYVTVRCNLLQSCSGFITVCYYWLW